LRARLPAKVQLIPAEWNKYLMPSAAALREIQSDRWEMCTFFQHERNRQGGNCSVGSRTQNINNFIKSPEAGVNLSTSIAPNWILLSGGSSRWRLFFHPAIRLSDSHAGLAVPRPEKWKILLSLPRDRGCVYFSVTALIHLGNGGFEAKGNLVCQGGRHGREKYRPSLSCDNQKVSNLAPFTMKRIDENPLSPHKSLPWWN
jgi:hypothetical protein